MIQKVIGTTKFVQHTRTHTHTHTHTQRILIHNMQQKCPSFVIIVVVALLVTSVGIHYKHELVSRLYRHDWPSERDANKLPRAVGELRDAAIQQGFVEDVESGIRHALGYLVRVCKSSGKFIYIYRFGGQDEVTQSGHYNILRHAGTLYTLAMGTEWCNTAPNGCRNSPLLKTELHAAIRRSSKYLMRPSVLREVRSGALGVWSTPPETNHDLVKLGGVGLGLAALCATNVVLPESDSVPLSTLRALGRTIVLMQAHESGPDFMYTRFDPELSQPWMRENFVDFRIYPGQAALGLVMLYEQDNDLQWLVAAARILHHLAVLRMHKGVDDIRTDHWSVIATSKFLLYQRECVISGLWDGCRNLLSFKYHAEQLLEAAQFHSFKHHRIHSKRYGCASELGSTCWHSCLLEASSAYYVHLPASEQHTQVQQLQTLIDGTRFLLRAQKRTMDKFDGSIAAAIAPLKSTFKPYALRTPGRKTPRRKRRHRKKQSKQRRQRKTKRRRAAAVKRRKRYQEQLLKWKRKRARFNAKSRDIRVDYVHHAVGAMMRVHSLFYLGPLATHELIKQHASGHLHTTAQVANARKHAISMWRNATLWNEPYAMDFKEGDLAGQQQQESETMSTQQRYAVVCPNGQVDEEGPAKHSDSDSDSDCRMVLEQNQRSRPIRSGLFTIP
jgi:hypothetical protein